MLTLGVPGMTDVVLDRRGYALGYSEKHEQPLWVAYRLTADEVRSRSVKRTDDFRVDPYISTGSARLEDYAKSGYDRGHLAPAADMGWSEKSMSESFYFSNMSPQNAEFNRGIWRKLEAKVRDWAVEHGELYVVTGPVAPQSSKVIGNNRVAVPQACYKVIYAPKAKPPAMIGFVIPNSGSDRRLHEYAVTVDAVESMTGLNFFSKVDGPLQDRLESFYTLESWSWSPSRR
ncbi:Nuclease [bioreactor metagenome]|uniref:Nuclease n=1 Tax=bioreactor metagenome TaxID=1076179 RepID=A0A645GFI9_9ZZZZ